MKWAHSSRIRWISMYLLVDGEPEIWEYVGPRRHQHFCCDLHGSEREWEIEPLIRSPRRTECLMTGDLTGAGALLQWSAHKRIADVGQFLMPSTREAFKHTLMWLPERHFYIWKKPLPCVWGRKHQNIPSGSFVDMMKSFES